MECPNCQSTVLPGDHFCESCGVPLSATAGVQGSPLPIHAACAKCGAQDLDQDGYCIQCGFRNGTGEKVEDPGERDRVEVSLSPGFAGMSDRGLRHLCNEDAIALHVLGDDRYILVVCDGVSSSRSPHIASQTAAQVTCQSLTLALEQGQTPTLALTTAFAAALEALCAIPGIPPGETDPPSTTIVAALVEQGNATIAWLGDSRAYWITPQGIQQLTQDHSWLNEMVNTGQLSEAEASRSPNAHAISRWLGADAQDDALPSITTVTLPQTGSLLLCSDGLWNYAPAPPQLAELVRRYADPDAIVLCRRLVEYARSLGGHDNISVVLYQW